jgi:hypothetical protein
MSSLVKRIIIFVPCGQEAVDFPVSSSSMLDILVGLQRSRISRPRSMDGGEGSLGRLPFVRNTTDSAKLIVKEHLYDIIGWKASS